MREHSHYAEPAGVAELDGDRVMFEDLSSFYPTAAQASPNGGGGTTTPGVTASRGKPGTVGALGGSPAVWVLVLAGVSLFLLHRAG